MTVAYIEIVEWMDIRMDVWIDDVIKQVQHNVNLGDWCTTGLQIIFCPLFCCNVDEML